MKKYNILLITAMFLWATGFAQVVVTGATNTTPALAATYTSLANAITALNTITSISGPVDIQLMMSNPQTAPAGGYVVQFSAVTTAANYVDIYGTNNTITAFTPQPAGSLNDAIFKLVGVDHVYIYNFIMRENPANSTTTPVASNNATEWGIALLRASQTDGVQYAYISGNDIALNSNYRNTFGIYSNVMHAPASPTVQQDITNATGSNSYDTLLYNTISSVDYGIVFIGSAMPAFMDNGNKIGGNNSFDGNTINYWGGNSGTLSAYALLGTDSYAIMALNQVNDNVSWNTVFSAAISGGTFNISGIFKSYSTTPTGTFSSLISNNTITISSANASGAMTAITSQGITSALSTATISITNNSILNCVISGAGTSTSFTGISNSSACGLLYITDNIIKGNTSTATTGGFTAISNSGNVTDSININDNYIGFNPTPAITFSVATTGSVFGINNSGAASTCVVTIYHNRIEKITVVTTGQVYFIRNTAATATVLNVTLNFIGFASNSFTFSGAQSASVNGIYVQNTTATCNVTIQNNFILGITHSVAGSADHQYITNGGAALNLVISDNGFTNLNVNTTGSVYFIINTGGLAAGGTSIVNNNVINTAFNKTGAGGQVNFYSAAGSFVNNSSMTETGNNFSNVTVTGATQVNGWNNSAGVSNVNGPSKTITGNTFTNIGGGSGQVTIIRTNLGAATNCSSNTITNITGTAAITGINIGSTNGQGTHDYASNSISSLISSGAGGDVKGIVGGASTIATLNINNNNIYTFSSTGASATITGIELIAGSTVNINNNGLFSFTGTGTASPQGNGIVVNGGTTVNVFGNGVYSIFENGAIATTSPAVNGMLFSGGGTVTVYNNMVGNLLTPNANLADAIRAISITSAIASSTFNLYYNSLSIAATSGGANFGTTTLYHAASATATTAQLNLTDNIINNGSTPNGGGLAVAFRRSGTALNNYASTSDYNDLYGGTPSASRLIYYDGTNSDQSLAAFQTRVSPREANSITVFPVFLAPSNLYPSLELNCAIDGRGTPIPGITTDAVLTARDPVTPDPGAIEFNPFYFLHTLAGVNGAAVCENKTVSTSGTFFANSSVCNLIAKVQSSGADPVAGKVNACVTLQATQQYFNAEPYVQRHYDIEPLTSNTTTTSATITLYFMDAEFSNFNTNNPVWPQLPTVAGGGNADPNRANLKVTQYHGTPMALPSTPGNYTGNAGSGTYIDPPDVNIVWNGWYWAVTFDVTGFSGFYVHTNIRYPLPVTINYFKGIKQGSDHLLSWKVNCNSASRIIMTLERSPDANTNFGAINTITSDAAHCTQPFNYTDASPLKGMNYYRLKITDDNGKITYSSSIALLNAATGSALISIAPNPVQHDGLFKLNITSAKAAKMELAIMDMQGRVVKQQTISMIAGYNSIDMNVSNLAPGTYHIRGVGDGVTGVLRFVKQ